MKYFTVDGIKYDAKEFTFNDVCKLEDMGINILNLGDMNAMKMFSLVRAYIAIILNKTPEQVGAECTNIDFEEVMEAFNYSLESSGFFRNLTKGTEKETRPSQSKAK